MRKLILAIVLLLCIFAVGILENYNINRTFSVMEEHISTVEQLAEQENFDEAVALLKGVKEYWQKHESFIEVFSYTPTIGSIIPLIDEAEIALNTGNIVYALPKLRYLKSTIENIRTTINFEWEHIV